MPLTISGGALLYPRSTYSTVDIPDVVNSYEFAEARTCFYNVGYKMPLNFLIYSTFATYIFLLYYGIRRGPLYY